MVGQVVRHKENRSTIKLHGDEDPGTEETSCDWCEVVIDLRCPETVVCQHCFWHRWQRLLHPVYGNVLQVSRIADPERSTGLRQSAATWPSEDEAARRRAAPRAGPRNIRFVERHGSRDDGATAAAATSCCHRWRTRTRSERSRGTSPRTPAHVSSPSTQRGGPPRARYTAGAAPPSVPCEPPNGSPTRSERRSAR